MSRRLLAVGVLLGLMSVGLSILPAGADEKPAPSRILVSDVIIQGNQRMSTEQIKVRLRTQTGKEFNQAALDEDVRELYKTQQFSNVHPLIEQDGPDKVKVYFLIRDLPNKIEKVTFLGAKHLKEGDLRSATGVHPGMFLNPKFNAEGCQKILEKYEEKGRSFASCVLVKGGQLGDTEVVYRITEGPKVKVRDIQFTGNTSVSSARLATQIKSLHSWFHVLGGSYNSKMAEADKHELEKYFQKFGYQDVKVSLETQRSADGGEITLIFHIHEGPRYTAKDIPQDNAQSIPHEQLEAMLLTKSGEHLDENKINADKTRIKNYYGYIGRDVQVQDHVVWSSDTPNSMPQVQYEAEEPPQARVSGIFKIKEYPTARIGQITITGNKRISSESILAHVPLCPGGILTYPDLKEAEKILAELDLFVVDPVMGVHPTIAVLDSENGSAYKDLLITVKEKKTKRTGGKSK